MGIAAIVPPHGRACGHRKAGDLYSEQGTSRYGIPLSAFIVDPPVVIDEKKYGLTDVGVQLVEVRGVTHIFDIVGRENYPFVADVLEEGRKFGFSRKLPKTIDFTRLTAESKHFLLHRRAWVGAFGRYLDDWALEYRGQSPCPKELPEHERGALELALAGEQKVCCAGVWWQDVEEGEVDSANGRLVKRTMPSLSYWAFRPPAYIPPSERGYELAIFYGYHPTRLALVKATDGSHAKTLERAERGPIPVEVVNE